MADYLDPLVAAALLAIRKDVPPEQPVAPEDLDLMTGVEMMPFVEDTDA